MQNMKVAQPRWQGLKASAVALGVLIGMAAAPAQATIEHLGLDAFVYGTVAGAEKESEKFGSGDNSSQVTVRIDPFPTPKAGDVMHLEPTLDALHLFSAATGERLEA